MFDPTTLDAPYNGAQQFLDNLDVYNTCRGTMEQLALVRELILADNYYWQGIAIPNSAQVTVEALKTINGSVQLPVGTYVTAINHYVDYETNPEGFKFKLYDKGTKASIFYGDYALDQTISSSMQIGQANNDDPFGPGYLLSPFIITNPGVLGWEIVNLSEDSSVIQMLLCCAVPINRATTNLRLIKKGK